MCGVGAQRVPCVATVQEGIRMSSQPVCRGALIGGPVLACAVLVLAAPGVQARDFEIGEVRLSVDTTLSYGSSFSIQETDCTNVNPANGGCYFGRRLPDFGIPIAGGGVNAIGDPIPAGGLRTITRSINQDDGALNFDSGNLVNSRFKATTDIEAVWRNFSLFVRTLSFHDTVYDRNNLAFKDLAGEAQDDLANEFLVLDAFVTANFDVADIPVTLRVGNQAVNWGESLLIQGGINSYLPVEVSRLRAPGAEVREGLLPVPAVYAQVGIVPGLDVQGFYQWEHVETEIDQARSFYSVADFAGAGGSFVILGRPDDRDIAPIVQKRFSDLGQDDGAWGVGLSYYADWLNQGTELQAYYVNFSSTLPYLTFQAPPDNFETTCDNLGLLGAIPDGYDGGPQSCVGDPLTFAPVAFAVSVNQGRYGFDFPDDIEIWGASFNTELFGTAFAGEVAYWPDLPLQLSDSEINARILDSDTSPIPAGELVRAPLLLDAYTFYGGASAIPAGLAAVAATTGTPYAVGSSNRGLGDVFEAFTREDSITGQLSSITIFAGSDLPAAKLGADQTTVIFNTGFMWVPDLPDLNETVVTAPGCEFGHPNLATALTLASGTSAKTNLKCASKFSAGYRFVIASQYNNIANTAWSLSPSVAVRKDVRGRSPGPYGPGFVAGQGQVGVGLTADYQNRWQANVQYLNFFGAAERNRLTDRDTISVSLSYAF